MNIIRKQSDGLTTNLKLSSVESRSKHNGTEPACKLLSTLRQCIVDEPADTANTKLAEDRVNLLDEAERANQEDNEIDKDEHRNNGRDFDAIEAEEMVVNHATAEKIAKSGFNVQCLTDLWTTGSASIERDDIKQKRINTKKRFDRKLEIMREIGELIEATERLIEKDSAWREETYLPEEPDWLKDVKSLSKFG